MDKREIKRKMRRLNAVMNFTASALQGILSANEESHGGFGDVDTLAKRAKKTGEAVYALFEADIEEVESEAEKYNEKGAELQQAMMASIERAVTGASEQ